MTPIGDGADLPAGTVTFLFTDLEGSTRLLQAHPHAYRDAVARHHALLREAVEAHGGVVFETVGDAVYAAFARPTAAVVAALAGQRALHRADWGELGAGALRARMALHTGEVEVQGGHYFGAPLYRAGRLLPAAHGGQAVLTDATAALVREALPAGAGLRDLGEHRLKDLQQPERVWQLLHPELPADFPPLRTLDTLPHNLPLQVTSFVGREQELDEVARLLAAHRLVTLTGPGGTGKTRLALQAAAAGLDRYPDGVWLVELAALADLALVPQAVASAVGVREEPGRPLLATLTEALRPRHMLLVLDNCEHLLDACARLADGLLRAGPYVHLLTTSREALGIAGESAWPVPSLAVPAATAATAAWPAPAAADLTRYAAVRLFAERAAAVQPGFAVTDDNAGAVAQVCARLDGIPLAIELAAARVRVLPPRQLLVRLDDRFRLLTGGSRTALERHQTLGAAVDWSYALLTEPERRLFARLAVFAGGWTLEAAEAVGAGEGIEASDVLDLLARLVDQSLVQAEAQPDGTARYRLLETLRQYGRERLVAGGEAEAVHARHAAYYLALAEHAEARVTGPEQGVWLDRLEEEQDNLRAVLRWLQEAGPVEEALCLAAALERYWAVRGSRTEGREWLAALLAAPTPSAPPARAKALRAAGELALLERDLPAAHAHFAEGLALARAVADLRGAALALQGIGHTAAWSGAFADARGAIEEALALFRRLGDELGTSYALYVLGFIALRQGDDDASRSALEEGLALARGVGDRLRMADTLFRLGRIAEREGDLATGEALATELLALAREVGYPYGVALALDLQGRLAEMRGDGAAAEARYGEALELNRKVGYQSQIPVLLLLLGHLARNRHAFALARARLAEAQALLAEPPLDTWTWGRWITSFRLYLLGDMARAEGDRPRAAALFAESLSQRPDGEPYRTSSAAFPLAGWAQLAAADEPERAAHLLGAALAAGDTTAEFTAVLLADHKRTVAAVRHRLAGAADPGQVETWIQVGRAMPLEQAIAYALEDAPTAP